MVVVVVDGARLVVEGVVADGAPVVDVVVVDGTLVGTGLPSPQPDAASRANAATARRPGRASRIGRRPRSSTALAAPRSGITLRVSSIRRLSER